MYHFFKAISWPLECLIVGVKTQCNCSLGYVWSDEVCYNYQCCRDTPCNKNISQIQPLCVAKVNGNNQPNAPFVFNYYTCILTLYKILFFFFNYKMSDVTFVFNAVSIIGSITLKDSSWSSTETTSVGKHLTKMSTFLKIMHSSALMFHQFLFSKLSSSLEILNGFESLNVTGLRYCALSHEVQINVSRWFMCLTCFQSQN